MSICGEQLWLLLEEWGVTFARQRRHSLATIKFNKKIINAYFKWLAGREHSHISINEFLLAGRDGVVSGRPWKQNSEHVYASKLKAFHRWLFFEKEILEKDTSHRIRVPGEVISHYDTISLERMKSIILMETEVLPRHNKKQAHSRRERRFYLLTILYMALRRSEPFTITKGRVFLDAETPYVKVIGKGENGGAERVVPIHPELIEDFRKRLEWPQIFTANVECLEKDFRTWRKKYNLPTNFSLHKVRHETGTTIIENGGTLAEAARILGHANTKMVDKYYVKTSFQSQTIALKTHNPLWVAANNQVETSEAVLRVLMRTGLSKNPNVTIVKRDGHLTLKV